MMSRHFTISAEMNLPTSSGVETTTSAPCSVNRSRNVGSARAAVNSWLSLVTIGLGVPFGASMVNHPELT